MTTAVRFHPLEIVISLFIKIVALTELGASPSAVLIFEIFLNATAMFNHRNVRIPIGIDRVLRWVIVTPDMHRVHHSEVEKETNCHFGFNLPWWDRVFGTYVSQPGLGHEMMTIGQESFRDEARHSFVGLLLLPFVKVPEAFQKCHALLGTHESIQSETLRKTSMEKREKVLISWSAKGGGWAVREL